MFPIKVFPGDLVEIEKASFILCCSRQAISHDWIGRALDCPLLFGLIIAGGEKSFIKVIYDDEWMMTDREEKIGHIDLSFKSFFRYNGSILIGQLKGRNTVECI